MASYILIVQVAQVGWTLGIPAAITRRVGLNESDASLAWVNASRMGVVTILASLICAATLMIVTQEMLPQVIALSLVGSACLALFTVTQCLLRALDGVRIFVAQSAALSILGPILGLLFLTWSHQGFHYIIALFMNQAIVTSIACVSMHRRLSPMPRFSRVTLVHDLRIGLPTIPHQWATVAVVPTICFAASSFGRSGVGETQVSLLIGTGPVLILSAFNNAWATQYYRVPPQVQPQFLVKSATVLTYAAVALALLVVALAPWAVTLLAGPDMDRDLMTMQVRVAAGAAGIFVLYLANLHPLIESGRTFSLVWRAPVNLVLVIIFLALVVRLQGSQGLLTVGYVVFIALQAWGISRSRALAWPHAISLRVPWLVAIGSLIVCAAVASGRPDEKLIALTGICLSALVAIGGARHVRSITY